jgi:phenylalanine-4-hydroxylase
MPTLAPHSTSAHGLAAGEAGRPARADWTIDQDWHHYTAEDHSVWKTLFDRQTRLLPGRACKEFVQGMHELAISADAIPNFDRLSEVLMRRTGWQIVAVPGLLPDDVFFEHLANRRFPSGNFIRAPHQLDYLQEPDVFHDVFGHVPMLMNPVMADFMQGYGAGGLRAQKLGVLDKLARVYWYTVEFGLVRQPEGLRLYGAGIVSSPAESVFALEDPSPHHVGFNLERVMQTHYRIDDFQETYFVLSDLEDLLDLARIDFGPMYERVDSLPEFPPGILIPGDAVIQQGSGWYACAKRLACVAQ